MESGIAELRERREKLRAEIKNLETHERERRHKLLDEFSELDTKIMVEQCKQGDWECDACGKWDKVKKLIIHDKVYDLCEKCYLAEVDE